MFFFFKQKTAYEMRISDWSSDVFSSDLRFLVIFARHGDVAAPAREIVPGKAADAKIAPVAGLADPILGVERDALIIVLGDDVDRPRDRIRSVDRDRKSTRLNSSH